MATVNTSVNRDLVPGAIILTYALTNADSGSAFPLGYSADLTVQVTGTFGSSTVLLEGSNDGTNWFTLTKRGTTTAASFTAAGGAMANENPAFIRTSSSGGTGATTSATVCITPRYAKGMY